MVFEIDSTASIVWDWFNIYRQEIIVDLSLIQIKPIFM